MDIDERTYLGGPDDFMTVRHLTIQGTNREIGQTLAETVIRRYGTSLADLRGDPPMVRARRDYLRQVYPVHWQRACGVASAFGIDPEDDRYDPAALTYNMGLPLPAMGCSVVYYPPATTSTGGGLLSRNYDFPTVSVAQIMGIPTPAGCSGPAAGGHVRAVRDAVVPQRRRLRLARCPRLRPPRRHA